MFESSVIEFKTANKNGRTSVPASEHPFPWWLAAVRTYWPSKTAAHLASLVGVTERAAKFWLSGDREPSPEAFRVVIAKMYERR